MLRTQGITSAAAAAAAASDNNVVAPVEFTPDVVIVGAGPISLLTAIQAALEGVRILLIEKRTTYLRSHALALNPDSFPKDHPNAEFQALINSVVGKTRTNVLEERLLQFALKIGVQIEYSEVTDCEQLARRFPDVKVIVGADGSRSIVRKQIFNDELQIDEMLQHTVEVKYSVHGDAHGLSKIWEMPKATAQAKHLIFELIGRRGEDGTTPVSIRIFVSESEYNAMSEATARTPFKLDDPRIGDHIRRSIQAWLEARAAYADEVRVEGSELVSVTRLPLYASKDAAKIAYGKSWLLVGDAFMGLPYLRGANAGALCSTPAARAIVALVNNQTLELTPSYLQLPSSEPRELSPLEYYEHCAQKIVKSEAMTVRVKDTSVNSMEYSAATVQLAAPISRFKMAYSLRSDTRDYARRLHAAHADDSSTAPTVSGIGMFSHQPDRDAEEVQPKSSCTLI